MTEISHESRVLAATLWQDMLELDFNRRECELLMAEALEKSWNQGFEDCETCEDLRSMFKKGESK